MRKSEKDGQKNNMAERERKIERERDDRDIEKLIE